MKDVQNLKDHRGIRISEVGISNLRIPLFLEDDLAKRQIIVDIKMGVDLFSEVRGAHMSRFAEIAEEISGSELNKELILSILKKLQERMKTGFVKTELAFVLFLKKKSPISQKEGSMNYNCKIVGELGEDNRVWNYFEVEVPIATLCPCSKEISDFGAHNQRASVMFRIKSREYIPLKEIIEAIEERSSGDLFSILKRADEKFMTEKMYNNPKFVEDIVRDIALWAKSDTRITDFIVKCKSFESIHNHNAYAIIINDENNVGY